MTVDELYRLKHLEKTYSGRRVLTVPELTLRRSCLAGIHGPNGGGKSTLLRILGLLEAPDKGSIRFLGRNAGPENLALRRRVAMLPQNPYLLRRSVLGNVTYGLKLRGERGAEDLARQALDTVGLPFQRFARRKWRELSGGETRRVALAARLALRPDALLLDEPLANLDPESAELIRQATLDARQNWGTGVILVGHDLEWLRSVCERILRVERGEIRDDSGAVTP
ncbi:MAG: energy-coupling factor ABC transporter ATP-binding protein [Desulfohalobiaceae bacterium]|nr:energy-coupling factor ABC transporter ATP-binding protein [Desulfohalobiaceae bacterium]